MLFGIKKFIFKNMKVPVNIRMPEEMKKAIEKIAANEFRSLNSVILQYLDKQLRDKGIEWQSKNKSQIK
ncbi:MAG TPA: Arc family DNA-binding protein [Desulfobacterales bacterium]|nr:Arc family DNA-binding protein [Desulfobacterales bacterium]